jgi:hypothetical protein
MGRKRRLAPVLAVIKYIYLPETNLHLMQDIEDRCLLPKSSTSFVDVPFQDQRTTEKHHINQNPYISSLCPKQGVVSDNMTRGDDMAKSRGPTDPRWGWPAGPTPWPAIQGLAPMKLCFQHVSCLVSKKRIHGGKVGASMKHGLRATLDGRLA